MVEVVGGRVLVPRAFGVAAAIASVVILGGCASETATPIAEPTSQSSEAAPSSDAAVDNGNQTVNHDHMVTPENSSQILDSLRIDEALPPEQVVEKITEINSRWAMAGATPEFIDVDQENAIDGVQPQAEALDAEVASTNVPVYAEALFGASWQKQTDAVGQYEDINRANLERFRSTFNSAKYPSLANATNKEAYTESWSDDTQLVSWATPSEFSDPTLEGTLIQAKAVLGDEDFLIVNFTAKRSNNADKNLYGADSSYAEDNGETLYASALLTKEGENYVVRYLKTDVAPITVVNYTTIPE